MIHKDPILTSRVYVCNLCGKESKNIDDIKNHMKQAGGIFSPQYGISDKVIFRTWSNDHDGWWSKEHKGIIVNLIVLKNIFTGERISNGSNHASDFLYAYYLQTTFGFSVVVFERDIVKITDLTAPKHSYARRKECFSYPELADELRKDPNWPHYLDMEKIP